jgi:uncharacterized protein YuzE
MEAKLSLDYDQEADILYMNTCKPYKEQESEELEEDIIARMNPVTGAIENLEILFFSARMKKGNGFELPVVADLKVSS